MAFDIKKYLPIIGVGLIILLIINMFVPLGGLLSLTSGTVLGLSQVSIIDNTNNQINSNKVWRATVALTGGGERLTGSAQTPFDKLVDQTTGIRSTSNFKIGYELKKYDVNYPLLQYQTEAQKPQLLQVQGVPLKFTVGQESGTPEGTSPQCAISLLGISRSLNGLPTVNIPQACQSDYVRNCLRAGGQWMISSDPTNIFGIPVGDTIGLQCIRAIPSTNYQWYEARSPQTTVEADVTATVGTDQRTVTLTSSIPQRVDAGGLFSANMLPAGLASFSSTAPSYDSFKVVKISDNSYISIATTDYNNLIGAVPPINSFTNRQNYDTALRAYNDRVRLLSQMQYSSVAGFTRTQQGTYSNNGYTIDLKDAPAIMPVIIVDVSSDWLGIERLIADGRIQDVSSCQLRANGQPADLSVNVRNAGSRGDLRVSTSCSGITVNPSTYISNNYESGSILTNRFTLTSSGSGTKLCTVSVQASNGSITDSRSINCNVQQECNAQPINLQRVDSNCNVYCPSDIQCGSNEVVDQTQCRCVARPIDSGSCTQGNRVTPQNARWDTTSCNFICNSGYVANAQGICSLPPSPERNRDLANILNFISANLLYIVGGICIIALIYVYAPKRGKKK